ncbi:MAG TPA: cation diffusion facilitator family transporter, partial [Nitrospira sp.]|nr:cation diffusion facilitator family transporter [Nitrospira sp.]
RAANQAIAFSAIGLALTGGIELGLAIVTNSVALLGDSLHNLADVSTSAVLFLGFFLSRGQASRSYPYGRERAEDLAGLGVALVIWISAVFAGVESYLKLVRNTPTHHVSIGMAAALLGMVGNYAVSNYKARIGKRIHSVTLVSDARHSWLDVVSSFGALVGLIGVAFGYRWADPVAGFAVTLFIIHVGYEVTHQVLHHLMDGVEPEHLEKAEAVTMAVPGVLGATVRGRWMGRSLILEIDGQLAGETALEQAHLIGQTVEHAVLEAIEEAKQASFRATIQGV